MFSLLTGQHHITTKKLHDEYGPVVRLAPDKLSCITSQAWKDIYGYKKRSEAEMAKDPRWNVPDPTHSILSSPLEKNIVIFDGYSLTDFLLGRFENKSLFFRNMWSCLSKTSSDIPKMELHLISFNGLTGLPSI